jgi:hypothetical protein
MNTMLQGALVANAAAMGFNWVYNMPYLERLASEQSLVFQPVDPAKYKRAGKAYLAYPEAQIGTISVQGEILRWLIAALQENPNLTKEQYQQVVFEQLKPGGAYVGYVESYAKQLIINNLNEQLKNEVPPLGINDDQLVGFAPYLATRILKLPNTRAYELAQAFTSESDFAKLYEMFDAIIEKLPTATMKQAIKESIWRAPSSYQVPLQKAMELTNSLTFITNHSGTACHISHAIPLIIHILYHASSFEEAVKTNVLLGGASCDRGTIIGAIYSIKEAIPQEWAKKIAA